MAQTTTRSQRAWAVVGDRSQLCELGLGLLQDGNVRIGVFPQREEVLIGRTRFGSVALECIGTGESEASKSACGEIQDDSRMCNDFLEFSGRLFALMGQ